jgi:hypothetical protein
MLPVATLLAFEAQWGAHTGHKEEPIRRELDVTPARYYQLLGRAIDTREALELDPLLVHRLQQRREEHRRRLAQSGIPRARLGILR